MWGAALGAMGGPGVGGSGMGVSSSAASSTGDQSGGGIHYGAFNTGGGAGQPAATWVIAGAVALGVLVYAVSTSKRR